MPESAKKFPNRRRRKEGQEGSQIVAHPSVGSTSFESALNAFITAHDAAGHSKVTLEDYKRTLGIFISYMVEVHQYKSIQQVTEHDVLDWLAHLRNTPSRLGRPYSSRTIESYCRIMLVFFHWLINHNYLAVNPVARVKSPKTEKALIRVFTEDELERLDAACDRPVKGKSLTTDERKALSARDRAFLWLLLSTGIRVSEACGLRFCDIDWDNGMIFVRGKGAKERKVPMGKVARQHLNTYITYWRGMPTDLVNEHVFLNAYGDPLRTAPAQAIFRRLKRVAGIKDKRVSAHTCRHWFAVNCIKRGMPSTVLQGLLGHEQLEMINTYVRLAEQYKREIYTRYSPVDALDMHHRSKGKRKQLQNWRNARKQANKGKSEGVTD